MEKSKMLDRANSLLKEVFGYDEFRPLQAKIIDNVLRKNDTLVIMPTGSGKSLCYQIPALIFDGLTVVVSPLISLMKDQVEQLAALEVPAVYLNSSLSSDAYQHNFELVRQGNVRLLYVAPETLLTTRLHSLLASQTISCFTIDEAHCISEWGHDFRPEYRQLMDVRARYPDAVCMALTATATPRVQADIKSSLGFGASNEFLASFNRENLFLRVVEKSAGLQQTVEFLREFPEKSGIIYCFSRRQVEDLSDFLGSEGFSVRPYHAGMSDVERQRNQEAFIRDDVQIIVATVAFGMGINKPNVRFVVHFDLPKNIEGYYQQIGRAGRDGLRAECLLLFGYGDTAKIRFFIDQKQGQEQQVANTQLSAMVRFAESYLCRRQPLLSYFGEAYSRKNCGMCDNCLAGERKLEDITVPAQMFLSCVKRTRELFGANHVIDVLRGSESQRIFKFDHQHLSTYGIGKDYSKKQWLHLSRQFVQADLLVQDSQHGSLKLTEKAYDALHGKDTVMGAVAAAEPQLQIRDEDVPEYDTDLFNRLRKRRKMLADEEQVAPYVIFPDKSLVEMAIYFPHTKEHLLLMHGVGAAKLERYGAKFISDILGHCRLKNIEDRSYLKRGAPQQATRQGARTLSGGKRKFARIAEAFNAGKSLAQLCTEFGVQQRTVVSNLWRFVNEGGSLATDRLAALETSVNLPPHQKDAVATAFQRLGRNALKPVYQACDEVIDYDVLAVLRLVHDTNKSSKETR